MIRGLTSLSFSDELLQQGYEIDMHVDKIELITNAQIAEKLTIDPEQPILCVRRIRLANGEPIAYQSSFVDSRLLTLEQAQTVYETKSFYKTLAQVNVTPVWVNENYSVRASQRPYLLVTKTRCFFLSRPRSSPSAMQTVRKTISLSAILV